MSLLLCFAVGGIIASIKMIGLNSRRDWNREKHDSLASSDPIASLSFKITNCGLVMLVCSAISFGIVLYYLVDELRYILQPPCYVCAIPFTLSVPNFIPWVIIAVAVALGMGWSVVARTVHAERARSKVITQDNVMNNDSRRNIATLIENNPGIHFSRMKTLLGLSPRTIRDQLQVLQSFGKISVVAVNGKKIYYVPDSEIPKLGENKDWLSMLAFFRRGSRENLLHTIFNNPGASFSTIVEASGEPRSTVRRKLEALEHQKYISITRMGNEMVLINLVPAVEEFARQVMFVEKNAMKID